MEIDHIIPHALGGLTEEDNLWLACSPCNERKGISIAGLDPLRGNIIPLFNPRRQIWQDHFAWVDDGRRILGLTPIGRITVTALQMNRPLIVRARTIWVLAGWHPPKD